MFMGALASIDTQLTDEQRTKIAEIRTDIEGKMKAWKDANGAQLQALEEKVRAARGGKARGGEAGGPPQGPPQGPPPEGGAKPDKATMEEMQKLRESMPKMESARDAIMAVLTPEQQATLKSNMVGMRKAMEKRGDKEGKRPGGPGGKGGEGGDGAPPKAPPPADPPKGDYKFPQ